MIVNFVRILLLALLISCAGDCFAQEISIQAIPTPGMSQAPSPFSTPGVESAPQQAPAQTVPGYTAPGQQAPGQTVPGYTAPGQQAPAQALPGFSSQGLQAPYTQSATGQMQQGPPGSAGQMVIPQGMEQVVPGGRKPGAQQTQLPFREIPAPAAPLLPGEELSDFEKFVAGKSLQEMSFDIKQFGYDLFVQPPVPSPDQLRKLNGAEFAVSPPVAVSPSVQSNVPVGPDYVIGPGDELRVNVWGGVEGVWSVTVDRDGKISLPKVGTLGLTGLTFQQVRDLLHQEFSKHFNDFEMNVSMGQLRTLRVYIVGKAKKPGAVTVSSLSTLINALVESGGPSKVGSMRDIQLKRNGETLAHLDLYDFLITGSKQSDIRLMSEDVIFIPTIGPMVGIAGNVKVPAIYELKGATRVSQLIKLAGGVTAKAYMQRVQVERVANKQNKRVLDLNLQSLKGKDDILLENGDIVKVFPITPIVVNKVVLKGNVLRPGEYEWRQGMRVRDILGSTKELLPETLMERAQIDRLVPPDYHLEYKTFNVGKLLLEGDESENPLLVPQDVVTIFNNWEVKERDKVRTAGALNRPGEYDFRKNMKLSDLIGLSGGLKYYALMERAELTRVTPTPDGPMTEKMIVYPAGALAGNPEDDITLKENDYLFVRMIPEWDLYKTVRIQGEVMFPGTYSVTKGEKLSSLLVRAGGYTKTAYLAGAIFTRESAKTVQQEQIKQMVERLRRDLFAASSGSIGAAVTPDEAKILAEQDKQKAIFLENLSKIQAKGRMIIDLDQPENLRKSQYDVDLEEGDVLAIPINPQSVQIIGAVYNQTGIFFEPGRDASYYIHMAGGYTENADKKHVYILKANGRAIQPKGSPIWNRAAHQWNVGYGQIQPGDTIIVPDKLDRVPWMRTIKDITQILFQIGTTAAVAFAVL